VAGHGLPQGIGVSLELPTGRVPASKSFWARPLDEGVPKVGIYNFQPRDIAFIPVVEQTAPRSISEQEFDGETVHFESAHETGASQARLGANSAVNTHSLKNCAPILPSMIMSGVRAVAWTRWSIPWN
jgi:hypothetical protein